MIEVTLSNREIYTGSMQAIMRILQNTQQNIQSAGNGGIFKDWSMGIESSLAEMAFCKWKGIYWTGQKQFAEDAGINEVRYASNGNSCLLIRPEDQDDKPYWLVTGAHGKYQVHGYILAGEAKKKTQYKSDLKNGRPPCWIIPPKELQQ